MFIGGALSRNIWTNGFGKSCACVGPAEQRMVGVRARVRIRVSVRVSVRVRVS